jgi:hypothetical protein
MLQTVDNEWVGPYLGAVLHWREIALRRTEWAETRVEFARRLSTDLVAIRLHRRFPISAVVRFTPAAALSIVTHGAAPGCIQFNECCVVGGIVPRRSPFPAGALIVFPFGRFRPAFDRNGDVTIAGNMVGTVLPAAMLEVVGYRHGFDEAAVLHFEVLASDDGHEPITLRSSGVGEETRRTG